MDFITAVDRHAERELISIIVRPGAQDAIPKISHAAIVGVPDPRLGERSCLCVIPQAGATLALAEVVDFLRHRVTTYELPEGIELFDDFPFTPTAKIQRHVLTRLVLDRRETRAASI